MISIFQIPQILRVSIWVQLLELRLVQLYFLVIDIQEYKVDQPLVRTDNYFHRPDFWNLSWNTTTVFGIGHWGQLSQDQFFPAVPLVPLDKLSLYPLLKHLQFAVLTVPHLLSPENIFLLLGLRLRFGLVWLPGLVGESPRTCMSHGSLGGCLWLD